MSSLPLAKSANNSMSTNASHSGSPALRRLGSVAPLSDGPALSDDASNSHKISAYARLDFDNYTFFVQTLQVVLGRKSNDGFLPAGHHSVDVHLSSKKAISRRHAKIFYNFGTQRFEISVLGRNGAFVDDLFIEKGITVHLVDGTRIQIGEIPFTFVLPSIEPTDPESKRPSSPKIFNPTEVLNLRSNLYLATHSPPSKKKFIAFQVDPDSEQNEKSKVFASRRSSKADIVRRLSVARRKSLASSSNDKISALLKELETFRDEGDEDGDLLEPAYLGRSLAQDEPTYEQIEKEEDEIDRLVKQHNLSQGVDLDSDTSLAKNPNLDVLDQEVVSLAPLIDAQQQHVYSQPHKDQAGDVKFANMQQPKYLFNPAAGEPSRTIPIIDKPVGPRMGKPAPIPPPSGSLYGRSVINPKSGAQNAGYGLSTAVYRPYGYSSSVYNSIMHPSPPKLGVSMETITSFQVNRKTPSFRAITVDPDPFEAAPVCVLKSIEPISNTPKIPKRKKDAVYRKPAKAQNYKEVPKEFKRKPTLSVLAMVSVVLRNGNPSRGQSFNEILDNIKELFPYYKYCPDGWQFTITHGIKFNSMFMAVLKEGPLSEWLWALDEKYIEERESCRKKLQELAVAKAKKSALRAVDYRQLQNYSSYPLNTATVLSDGGLRSDNFEKAETSYMYTTPPRQMLKPGQEVTYQRTERTESSIKGQLTANREQDSAIHAPQATQAHLMPVQSAKTSAPSSPVPLTQDVKKSLTYLQKELFTLYKARDLSYHTTVAVEIITKALATTIAQVNTIGAKAGCGNNALGFLVEKAPQQVSKILDIALTKSIKEHQSGVLAPVSRTQSPMVNPGPALGKPPGVAAGLGRPFFGGPRESSGSKLGPIRSPQFFSNKPLVPEKRPAEKSQSATKAMKLEK